MCQEVIRELFPKPLTLSPQNFSHARGQISLVKIQSRWFCIPWLSLWSFLSCFMHSHSLTPKGFSNVNLVCPLCRTLIEQTQCTQMPSKKSRWGLATTTCPAWYFLSHFFSILTVHQKPYNQIPYFNATGIFLWRSYQLGHQVNKPYQIKANIFDSNIHLHGNNLAAAQAIRQWMVGYWLTGFPNFKSGDTYTLEFLPTAK